MKLKKQHPSWLFWMMLLIVMAASLAAGYYYNFHLPQIDEYFQRFS